MWIGRSITNVHFYVFFIADAMTYHNGEKFSTRDQDNDNWDKHCAQSYLGAWWYKSCHYANLNGQYGNVNYAQVSIRHLIDKTQWLYIFPHGNFPSMSKSAKNLKFMFDFYFFLACKNIDTKTLDRLKLISDQVVFIG